MQSMGKTLLLLLLSHQSLSRVVADDVNEIISRLDSLKNALSESYFEHEYLQELEPVTEPDGSLNLNKYFEDEELQGPEPEPELVLNETIGGDDFFNDNDDYEYDYTDDYDDDYHYDHVLKVRDVINNIPDTVVRESVKNNFNLGQFAKAQTKMHEYLERYISEAKSEDKTRLKANKETILRYFDKRFEKMAKKSKQEYAPENKLGNISDNKMIDAMPGKNNGKVGLETTNGSGFKSHDLNKQEIDDLEKMIIKNQQMIKEVLEKMGDAN